MQAALLLLWIALPVIQDNQEPEQLRSTAKIQDTQLDSVELPTAPLTVKNYHEDFVEVSDIELRNLSGSWQLSWNDDLKDESFSKTCDIKFQDIDGQLNGSFVGPVEGCERDAIITGSLEGEGQARILSFQQRERGYICSYQGIDKGGAITGVWHDTQNRSGRFMLLKYQ